MYTYLALHGPNPYLSITPTNNNNKRTKMQAFRVLRIPKHRIFTMSVHDIKQRIRGDPEGKRKKRGLYGGLIGTPPHFRQTSVFGNNDCRPACNRNL